MLENTIPVDDINVSYFDDASETNTCIYTVLNEIINDGKLTEICHIVYKKNSRTHYAASL